MSEATVGELVVVALAASRAARRVLGEASDALASGDEQSAEVRECERLVHSAIVALCHAPDAEFATLAGSLATAAAALSTVLQTLQSTSADGLEGVITGVASAMTSLYPVIRGFERAMAPGDEEPVLLARKRRVLEIVAEEDDEEVAASDRSEGGRRQAPRVELSVDIGYHSDTNFFAGFSDDVSEGGLFVATYDLLAVGTPLALSFILPHGPLVAVRGRVAWIREPADFGGELRPGMGVAFEELDDAAGAAIRRFMAARAPIFHD